MHYVIVLLFLQHFHKEARKQLAGRSNFLKYSIGHFAFLDLTFCICVVTLKSPHNLFVLPTIIKKNPCKPNPTYSMCYQVYFQFQECLDPLIYFQFLEAGFSTGVVSFLSSSPDNLFTFFPEIDLADPFFLLTSDCFKELPPLLLVPSPFLTDCFNVLVSKSLVVSLVYIYIYVEDIILHLRH